MIYEPLLKISYVCPSCAAEWQDLWTSACDSECGECGQRDVQPTDWEGCECVAEPEYVP